MTFYFLVSSYVKLNRNNCLLIFIVREQLLLTPCIFVWRNFHNYSCFLSVSVSFSDWWVGEGTGQEWQQWLVLSRGVISLPRLPALDSSCLNSPGGGPVSRTPTWRYKLSKPSCHGPKPHFQSWYYNFHLPDFCISQLVWNWSRNKKGKSFFPLFPLHTSGVCGIDGRWWAEGPLCAHAPGGKPLKTGFMIVDMLLPAQEIHQNPLAFCSLGKLGVELSGSSTK